ncbi:MAG: formylglycine-generating enzyme family protein [Pyrinomonadaceae bacterium]|nr:formylglycine-generating enzyme family protein [Pyrinomonadaceae bacterium]
MTLVAGGSFQMGRSDVPKDDFDYGNQYPAHPVSVGSFYLDKTEVNNEEYAEFVRSTNRSAPSNWKDNKPPAGEENFPVSFVALSDANAFAEWVAKREKKPCRLPTEEEWEFAARNGSRQTTFPWGEDWKPDLANVASNKVAEVGKYPEETLTGNFKDMLGNVLEWTSTKSNLYDGHPGKMPDSKEVLFVVRGSSFGESQNKLKNAQWMITRRREVSAEEKNGYLGFRLVCQDK